MTLFATAIYDLDPPTSSRHPRTASIQTPTLTTSLTSSVIPTVPLKGVFPLPVSSSLTPTTIATGQRFTTSATLSSPTFRVLERTEIALNLAIHDDSFAQAMSQTDRFDVYLVKLIRRFPELDEQAFFFVPIRGEAPRSIMMTFVVAILSTKEREKGEGGKKGSKKAVEKM